MKKTTIFFIIVFAVCLFFPNLTSGIPQENSTDPSRTEPNNIEIIDDIEDPTDDEEIIFSDYEIFSRKLFQKTLPPLKKKQKIIWAFRMSQHDLFL